MPKIERYAFCWYCIKELRINPFSKTAEPMFSAAKRLEAAHDRNGAHALDALYSKDKEGFSELMGLLRDVPYLDEFFDSLNLIEPDLAAKILAKDLAEGSRVLIGALHILSGLEKGYKYREDLLMDEEGPALDEDRAALYAFITRLYDAGIFIRYGTARYEGAFFEIRRVLKEREELYREKYVDIGAEIKRFLALRQRFVKLEGEAERAGL